MTPKEELGEEQKHPLEHLLEASLVNNSSSTEETNKILEAILEHNSDNDLSPLLEAQIVLGQKNKDEIIEAIKGIPEAKIPEQKDFPTKMEMELKGISVLTIKGDKGNKGDKGEKGDSGKDGKDGKNGYTPQKGKDYFDGKDGKDGLDGIDGIGKDGKDGKDGSPDNGKEIVRKLQALVGKDRLDKSAIKGLKEIEDSITRLASSLSTQKGGNEWLMGGLHRVYTDSTLTGDGTEGNPLHAIGGGSGSQTPWTSDIDAAGFNLDNVGVIEGYVPYTGATASVDLGSFDLSVADEAYGVGWDSSLEVPTKNAVYDKIESLVSGIIRLIIITSGSITAGATARTDYVYLVSGTHTITMPTAINNSNRYTIKNNHVDPIIVNTSLGQNIELASSIDIQPEDSVDIISDGSNWWII